MTDPISPPAARTAPPLPAPVPAPLRRAAEALEAEGRRAFWCRRRAQAAEVALSHVNFATVAAAGRLVGPARAGHEK